MELIAIDKTGRPVSIYGFDTYIREFDNYVSEIIVHEEDCISSAKLDAQRIIEDRIIPEEEVSISWNYFIEWLKAQLKAENIVWRVLDW